jgi:hypothetical protein
MDRTRMSRGTLELNFNRMRPTGHPATRWLKKSKK